MLEEHEEFLRLFLLLLITNEDADVAEVLDRVRAEARARMHELLEMAFESEGTDTARVVADRLSGLAVVLFDGTFLAAQIDGAEARGRTGGADGRRALPLRHGDRDRTPVVTPRRVVPQDRGGPRSAMAGSCSADGSAARGSSADLKPVNPVI